MSDHTVRPDTGAQATTGRLGAFVAGFHDHPASVGESYGQHFRFALGFSGLLAMAGLAAFVHALIPPLFPTTASRMVRRLHDQIERRH